MVKKKALLPYEGRGLAAVGCGSSARHLGWPAAALAASFIFLLQRRRLVKGKDVRGGGGSGERVSRDLWELSRDPWRWSCLLRAGRGRRKAT